MVVEQLICETYLLGPEGSAHRVRIQRHEFHVSENVARILHAKGIRQVRNEEQQEAHNEWRE
ncbi:hypothetical protein D9M69_690170 [compost metagenome]